MSKPGDDVIASVEAFVHAADTENAGDDAQIASLQAEAAALQAQVAALQAQIGADALDLGQLSITITAHDDGHPSEAKFDLPNGTSVTRPFPPTGALHMRLGLGMGLTHQQGGGGGGGEHNVAPVITSNGGGATASLSVAENQTAVTTVTATDANLSDTLTYSIVGGADAARFAIGSSSGVLTFVTAPDYESPTDADVNNDYVVIVQVSDGALTDTQAITVTVANVEEGGGGGGFVPTYHIYGF